MTFTGSGVSIGRLAVRILQIAFVAMAGLLVVPFAVNIETGGQTPEWLRPLRRLALAVGGRLRGAGHRAAGVGDRRTLEQVDLRPAT